MKINDFETFSPNQSVYNLILEAGDGNLRCLLCLATICIIDFILKKKLTPMKVPFVCDFSRFSSCVDSIGISIGIYV